MTGTQNAGYGFVGVFDRYKNEGKAEGKAESVLGVLERRGLDVPEEVRERVLACSDSEMLELLLTRALSVTDANEIFD